MFDTPANNVIAWGINEGISDTLCVPQCGAPSTYNNHVANAILIGSGIEVSLLSFALADKINTYRKEREEMQLQAQAALQENVRIVREQNIILDQKVNESTHELKLANVGLTKAMKDLKDAEAQLVEQEKMASLGQ